MNQDDSRKRKASAAPLMGFLVSLALFLLVGGYVWAYRQLGKWSYKVEDGGATRYFDSEWKAIVFTPAAKAESLLRRRDVEIGVGE